jgi:hypothetical protein
MEGKMKENQSEIFAEWFGRSFGRELTEVAFAK